MNAKHRRAWVAEFAVQFVLAVVGIAYCIYASRQLTAMNEQLSAMREQLQVARDDQRPWVAVAGAAFVSLIAGEKPAYVALIKNTGRTPALDMRAQGSIYLTPSIDYGFQNAPQDSLPAQATLGPDAQISISDKLNRRLTEQDIEQLSSGKLVLYISGTIDYRDVFGRPHRTTYCLSLNTTLASGEGKEEMMQSCPSGNNMN